MEMHNGCLRKTGAGCAVSSKDWNNLQVSFPMIGIITVGNIIRSFRPSAVMQGLLPFIVVFVLWMPTRAAGPAQAGGSDIGQELQNTEKLILKSSKPSKKRVKPEVLIQDLKGSKEEKTGPVAAQSKVGYKINKLLVRGDQDILEQTKLFDELNKEVVGQMFTAKDIQALVRKYNKLLVDKGYYLAGISTPPTDYSKGVLILEVDKGRVGKMSFYKMPRTDQSATMSTREPYRGTFYSESQ